MADGLPPAGSDPFADILAPTSKPETLPQSTGDHPPGNDPFADIVQPYEEGARTGTGGAFAREAAFSAIPSAGGLAGIGPGAEIGGAIGLAGGPFAEVTVPAGAFIGGVAGMFGGSWLAGKAQDTALSSLPEDWQESINDQRRIDQTYHPTASFLGGLLPYLLTMKPGGFARGAPLSENATMLKRIMTNPVTAHLFGGAVMGGMELGQEAASGQRPDWTHVAIATGLGLVFNQPNSIGKSIMGIRGAPAEPTLAQASDAGVMGPGLTEEVFQGSHEHAFEARMLAHDWARTEQSIITPQPAPDLFSIARRLDPDTMNRYDELAAQRDSFRARIDQLANPSDEDIAAATERQGALQTQLDEHIASRGGYAAGPLARQLRAQIREGQAEIEDLNGRRAAYAAGTGEDTPEMSALREQMMQADFAMRDLAPARAAALRRAADATSGQTVAPEGTPDGVTVDRSHDVPYGGGSSNDGSKVYIDKDMPTSLDVKLKDGEGTKPMDPAQFIVIHEVDENHSMTRLGMPYETAHRAALVKERAAVEGAGFDFADYQRQVLKAVDAIEHKGTDPNIKPPADLYTKPYPHKEAEFIKHEGEKTAPTPAPAPAGAPPALASPAPVDIVDDVTGQLVRAGRPEDEALAAGQLIAARYRVRVAWFNGQRGTAEDLYRAEGAAIRGSSGEATPVSQGVPEYAQTAVVRTETPEFRQWFGDSKIVDADGKPLVVYHGTTSRTDFSEFGVGEAPVDETGELILTGSGGDPRTFLGSHFAREPGVANKFAAGLYGERQGERTGGRVYPVYLKIEKPFRTSDSGMMDEMLKGDYRSESVEAALDFDEENSERYERDEDYRIEVNEKALAEEAQHDEPTFDLAREMADQYRAGLREKGYDGIVYENEVEGGTSYIVFAPEQIKSVANIGTFSPTSPNILEQVQKGKIRFAQGQRPLITLAATADASTFIHESGHDFLEQLMRDAGHDLAPDQLKADAQTALKWMGVDTAGDIKTRQHEKFARGFEQYMREGVAPSPGLASVFAKFKNWLTAIYQTIKGLGAPISEDIRQVFDRMLSTEPQRTVIAEGAPGGPSLADIHEADAKLTEPQEAAAAIARVREETARAAIEVPANVRAEIELRGGTAEPGAGSVEPGRSGGGGAGGVGALPGAGGAAGPVAANGALAERPGAVGAGSGATRPEGTPAPGGEPGGRRPGPGGAGARPGAGDGQQLAPRAADTFGPAESPLLDKAGNIRIENLTTRDDVAQAIRDAARANNDFIGDRRGVVTDGQVMELADALGMNFESLNVRRIGQAFNAEQVMAARQLLIRSATAVSDAMKKAAIGPDEDVLAYAEARDRHQMIQGQVAGITAEAGRALRAFRSIAGEPTASIDQFVRQATGKTLFQLRMEARMGSTLDTPGKVSKYLADAQKRSFGRMILEYWINGLISGPATHATYSVGNTILAMQKAVPETAAAALVGRVFQAFGRPGGTVRAGEVGARLRAMLRSLPAGTEASLEAMQTGMTTLLPGENVRPLMPFSGDAMLRVAQNATNDLVTWADVGHQVFGMVRGLRDGLIAGADLIAAGGHQGAPPIGFRYSPLGQIPDVAIRGVPVVPIGSAIRLPGRFIAAIHSFFRAVNYSSEKAALAYRTASDEGLTGNAFDARVADLRQNPTDQMMEQSRGEATQLTLMGKGSAFVQALSRLTNTEIFGFPLLKFIDPFVHIAGNIIDQSIIQRTPVGILAPEIRADLMGRNGPIAQDMAAARMLCGTALSVVFGGLAAEGLASGSGPADPHQAAVWRLAGNQAHSVRIGDMWYDVHRLGPMGMLMGIAADLYDVAHTASQGDVTQAASMLQHAFTQNILDESFMRGPADLIKAVEEPGRYGEAYLRNFVGSFIPFSVGMAQMARNVDPYSRDARTIMDTIKRKVPGLSESLMPRRDLWGEPLPSLEGFGGGITSIYEQRVSRDPVNLAMLRLGVFPATLERRIRNVDLTPEQYDDFARIAGRMAKQRLDVIVRSPDFQTWAPFVQHDVMTEVIRQSRESARGIMMMKQPQIVRDATAAKLAKVRGVPVPPQ